MFLSKVVTGLLLALSAYRVDGYVVSGKPNQMIKPYKRAPLQDIVTWDKHSVFVRGERILLFNGEFHPFRLPVPSLWLDVFQKIKAAGFSGVSFYVDWALLEGKPGDFSAHGVFALEPFFQAATEAGIYLVARPGPYINAEVSGGGFPGWTQRIKASQRTQGAIPSTENYVKNIGPILAKAQITNGGPIILFQPENEYTYSVKGLAFPDKQYFQDVEDQFRNLGIVVPYVSNDAGPLGYFAPGTGQGAVDIYGHDGYPLGFDCANPYTWPDNALPTNYLKLHLQQSPNTPYTISEFQGGSFDPWGGSSFAKCATLLNEEFERVFYKNNYAVEISIFNLYMIYGGTNWGNLGHPGGYTSYDYGASISEDRTVTREKYSEVKLETNFLRASGSAYLTATGGFTGNGSYVNTPDIATTRLTGNVTNFYVVRHSAYNSLASTSYKLEVPTTAGTISIPQLSSTLTLNGRDSKIHVTDYDVGGINLLYSSAEIFTWKKYNHKTVLVLYGGPGETHEAAFAGQTSYTVTEGTGVQAAQKNGSLVLNWAVTPQRKVVQVGSNLFVYILDRNDAYNYWVLDLPQKAPLGTYSSMSATSVIVKAGYLLRTAKTSGTSLLLTGDLNTTTTIEVIGAPVISENVELSFNGKDLQFTKSSNGVLTATAEYKQPSFDIPKLTSLDWQYIDSLPEILPTYDDSAWPSADLTYSNNTIRAVTTPVSLYSSDYGFHTGNLLYRGHFTATGAEKTFYIQTQGGAAFGVSVFLRSTLLGSWPGSDKATNYNQTLTLPTLTAGKPYILTVLQDNMGLDEDFTVGSDTNKNPRGILNYQLSGRPQSAISWKLTGNLGGENYQDRTRGPLNEGGLYAERQGYHLPRAPTHGWASGKPTDGLSGPGVRFYTTKFELDGPDGYDIPLSFVFTNSTGSAGSLAPAFRCQLYVNGYQFGKYVNNVGPQTAFPVPEGILTYQGTNHVAVSFWALDAAGDRLADLALVPTAMIQSGFGPVRNSPMDGWQRRVGAY